MKRMAFEREFRATGCAPIYIPRRAKTAARKKKRGPRDDYCLHRGRVVMLIGFGGCREVLMAAGRSAQSPTAVGVSGRSVSADLMHLSNHYHILAILICRPPMRSGGLID
jgi:hypothetical protein